MIEINKNGVNLNFNAQKNITYLVYSNNGNEKNLIAKITNFNEKVTLTDYNAFKYEEIDYYIEDINSKLISNVQNLRPKDYLEGLLNKEINSTKKKWLV